MFLHVRHPLLIDNFCGFMDSWLVLARAHNHHVPYAGVWSLTAKALVSMSQLVAGGARGDGRASFRSLIGVAI
jgi:hypothetical protein